MKYVITGGMGFIGSALAHRLKGAITIVSRSMTHTNILKSPKITIVHTSVGKLKPHDIAHTDVIYHCASTVDNFNILTDPYKDVDNNIKETIHLLELCKDMKKKPRIVFLSTFFVYGNQYSKENTPLDEESATNPLSLYPATKLCAETAIKLYAQLYHIPYTICRLTNIYGPEDKATSKKGVLNYFVHQALHHKPLKLYNGGRFWRDYVYIDDAVEAIIQTSQQKGNHTFLIGSGSSILFADMIKLIHTTTQSTSPIITVAAPRFHEIVGITDFKANVHKLKSIGWYPKISHKQGIQRIVDSIQRKINAH